MQHTQKFHLKWQVAKFAEVAGVALKYNVLGPEGPGPLCNSEISFSRKETSILAAQSHIGKLQLEAELRRRQPLSESVI